jgi:hypothetical protein
VLAYDMVFVPRMPLSRELLGLGTSVARAVPSDLLVALASRVAPADLVQKLILAGILVGGGWGAARLAPVATAAGGAAAASLFVWNAHVYERLLIGHWALLVSYAALPWVVSAALRYRAGTARVHGLVAALAVAACGSPPGAAIAAGTALAVVAGRPWRRAAVVLAAALAVNAPWLLPSVLHPGGVPLRPAGAAAFAARPDGPLGTLGSLLGLGGIWSSLVVPPGHGSATWWPAFAAVLAVAAAGWLAILARGNPRARPHEPRDEPARRGGPGVALGMDRRGAVGLLCAAAVGLAIAAAYAVPALRPAVDLMIARLPGGGMIRDSQKFVAPLALVEAVGFGVAAELVLARLRAPRWRALAATALVAAPVLLLPGLALGAAGRLQTVRYPADWAEARRIMAGDPAPGAMLVLPWHLYLGLPWNGDRVVLDPAQRYFTRRAVGNDDLELPTVTVPGEDPYGGRLGPLVRGAAPLAPALPAHGIRYVLVLKVAEWAAFPRRLDGAERLLDGADLALYQVRGTVAPLRFPAPPAAPVIAGDVLAVAVFGWACAGVLPPVAPYRRRLVFSRRAHEGSHR